MKEPQFHIITYHIKGLNIGKEPFVWNNKLLIKDAGDEYGNIAEARIFMDKPIPDLEDDSSEREGMLLISVFLACFKLVNSNLDVILEKTDFSSHSAYEIEELWSEYPYIKFISPYYDSPKHPENNCKKYLKDTIPLFEKIVQKIDYTQKNKKNPLSISLPLFQRIRDDGLNSIIDYVTILESLVCENEGELRFKFALRTTLLVEKELKKRESTFESLKEIYNYRSKLVHGSDISFDLSSEDNNYGAIMWLESICKRALLEYIELVSSGLSKQKIIKKLDMMALGNG